MHNSTVSSRSSRQSAKGQTLVELMVVVVIIAVIAGALLFNYAHAKSAATVAVAQADLKSMSGALETYNGDNQAYPASGTVAPALFGANSAKYIPGTPTSPGQGGGTYTYTLDATGQYYTIVDPATYESASLAALPKGTAPAAGVEAAPVGKCGAAGTCTHVGFSNAGGLFAY